MDAAFIDRVLARDPRAIARALSIVVDESTEAETLLRSLNRRAGRAVVIGVTGPPGAGKSTLVDRLISSIRRDGETVAVLAIDPSSPFSGGAMLGDRVRMQDHAADEGVFIRSLATRGHLGGLTATSRDAVTVLDAAGFDRVVLETVGVGQGEVDVARLADVCVVVLVPGTGDEVQALKAGLMEIADIFVVNKADLEGADRMVAAIEAAESLAAAQNRGPIPVLRAVAITGEGVDALTSAIDRVSRETSKSESRRVTRASEAVRDAIVRRILRGIDAAMLADAARRVAAREIDPHGAALELLTRQSDGGVQLDHVAIAADDPSTVLTFLRETFGIQTGASEEVPSQHVRVQFADCGSASLEVVEPLDATSPVARFLARRGPGLHHVAFQVADLAATLTLLKARGVRLIDDVPRVGAHGRAIAFVHPSSAGGVLIELVEKENGSRAVR